MLEPTTVGFPMTPEGWAAVDAMRLALRRRCARVTCLTCGGPVPVVWDIRREGDPEPSGPRLGSAVGAGLRVTAVRHARFCSMRCDLIFVQHRLRRDGPEARLAVGAFASS